MITVNLSFAGLTGGNATAAHIHAPGAPGVNAPVIINFTGFPAATTGTYSNTFAITPTQVTQLQGGLAYLNIHNAVFPGGEIRGQLALAPNSQVFTATLDGTQEVPPNASTAAGSGIVVLNEPQTMVTVDLSFAGLTGGNATAAHIHAPGAPGVNAPVIINFPGFPAATSGTYSDTFAITPTQVTQLQGGLAYLNIHNAVFPGGEIRGQLALAACPPISTPTPTATPTSTVTPSASPTATASPSASPSASATPSASPSASASPSVSPTATPSPTVSPTATPSASPTATPSPTCPPGGSSFLYALNDNTAGDNVYGFQVNEGTGALTALPGSLSRPGAGGTGLVSERMVIDSLNRRLYVINDGSDSVSAYSINPVTGAISPLPVQPHFAGRRHLEHDRGPLKWVAADCIRWRHGGRRDELQHHADYGDACPRQSFPGRGPDGVLQCL